MTTLIKTRPKLGYDLPLENGDRLDQKTFHARYEGMPEDFRAELIGGTVFLASPIVRPHGRARAGLVHWLTEYEEATPGTEALVAPPTFSARKASRSRTHV